MSKRTLSRWYPLLLTSGAGLFLEMAVIRWVAAEVRLFSYFKNLALLAAFLGLAVGFGIVGRGRDYRPTFGPWFALFVAATLSLGHILSVRGLVYPGRADEFLWRTVVLPSWLETPFFVGLLLAFFLLIVYLFIPLGQATGEEMACHDPVPAYIVNLIGSLAGIWVFALLSYLQTPPAVWFGLGMLAIGFYLFSKGVLSRFTALVFVLALAALIVLGRDTLWSPYQRLDVSELFVPRPSDGQPVKIGYQLMVQQTFYQIAVDLSEESVSNLKSELPGAGALFDDLALSYNLPFTLGPKGAEVLVVGAGMGNDVAAALRHHATHVDAVEIDPTILQLGRELHPEAPYDDPRVNAIVDDARSFFAKSPKLYDVIAFGLLDSHTLLSGLSNVRLDSFVYTLDSFEQVREHLNEDGLLSLTFAVGIPWIEERLGQMLVQVFGSDHVYVHQGLTGPTFVAGEAAPNRLTDSQLVLWESDVEAGDVPVTTDDWPYLYLRTRKVPTAYWHALLVIGLVCSALILRSFPEALQPNWHFWLLGAAFLLVEFKSVTELALLFGTTWLVNVLAISGVLVMALAANLVVLRRPRFNLKMVYLLLLLSLALNYWLPLDLLIGWSPTVRAIGSMMLLSLPLFFAGLIFSESLRLSRESTRPLASNLSGSVAGGVLEHASLLWGIKSLYVIAAIVYVGALVASSLQRE